MKGQSPGKVCGCPGTATERNRSAMCGGPVAPVMLAPQVLAFMPPLQIRCFLSKLCQWTPATPPPKAPVHPACTARSWIILYAHVGPAGAEAIGVQQRCLIADMGALGPGGGAALVAARASVDGPGALLKRLTPPGCILGASHRREVGQAGGGRWGRRGG